MSSISVYCCIRPLPEGDVEDCCRCVAPDTVLLQSPQSCRPPGTCNAETKYTFRKVFTGDVQQSELFTQLCIPLLADVLAGRDALLLTYGASGSGKTYSIAGTAEDPGMLPRSIDTIFNSINLLDKYCLSRNVHTNEFTLLTDADRMLERQRRDLIPSITNKQRFVENALQMPNERIRDESKIFLADKNARFAVFVTYVEVYNRYVYDLLEETELNRRPQIKILREDKSGRMFVRESVEIEVRSADEAHELFRRGSQRRHSGRTDVNMSSSRSHAIFTLRLVRVSDNAESDENIACISQLSMVDLAGSERIARANPEGQRLRETHCINTSLLALRNCFEALRSCKTGAPTLVPYRDSKLTTLFKHYFEGHGRIVMLLCVNPSVAAYDENVHVMKFAEGSQQIQRPQQTKPYNIVSIKREVAGKRPLAEHNEQTPARKINRLEKQSGFEHFPKNVELESCYDENTLPGLCAHLEKRSAEVEMFLDAQLADIDYIRCQITHMDSTITRLRSELDEALNSRSSSDRVVCQLRADIEHLGQSLSEEQKEKRALVEALRKAEAAESNLLTEVEQQRQKIDNLNNEISRAREQLYSALAEKDRLHSLFQRRVGEIEREARKTVEREILRRQLIYANEVSRKEEKLRRLRDIITSEDDNFDGRQPALIYRTECMITPRLSRQGTSSSITTVTPNTTTNSSSVPGEGPLVANWRQQRNVVGRLRWRSADVWLDHRPRGTVQTDGVLQPTFKKRRSVSCISLKMTLQANKYALTDQHQTRDGDLVTRLVKGEILASPSGGANVIFTDVETVRLTSPRSKLAQSLTETDQGSSTSTNNTGSPRQRTGPSNDSVLTSSK